MLEHMPYNETRHKPGHPKTRKVENTEAALEEISTKNALQLSWFVSRPSSEVLTASFSTQMHNTRTPYSSVDFFHEKAVRLSQPLFQRKDMHNKGTDKQKKQQQTGKRRVSKALWSFKKWRRHLEKYDWLIKGKKTRVARAAHNVKHLHAVVCQTTPGNDRILISSDGANSR